MKVASFSGGGERGLIGLAVIDYLEGKTGKHAQDLFDGFAGSSTGAITALALAKPNPLWARELINLYLLDASRIFPGGFFKGLQSVFGLKGDKYSVRGLESLLKQTFGDLCMNNLVRPVCITTVNATTLESIFLTEKRSDWKVWEAARASSAGPTFFAPFVKDGCAYVDGGVTQNCPDMVAADRWDMWQNCTQQSMLSLGTGVQNEGWTPNELNDIGELRWASKVITMALDGVARQTVNTTRDLFVKGRYLRLDPALPNDLGDMDQTDPKKLARLLQLGRDLTANNSVKLDAFLGLVSK